MHGIPHEVSSTDMGDKPVTCKPHLQKWIEATSQNPNPDQLYVVQANSFEDIKKRMEVSK